MKATILEARNLVKKYGDLAAVKDVNLAIQEGEILGLLGPDRAGKSTVISMLTCLFPPTSGTARVYSHDVVADADQVKRLIGLVPQDLALYPTLSGRDNLRFFGRMFGLAGEELRGQVESVLEYVAMTERAGDPVKTYSGGMKRRVSLALGLIHRPRILFLDEPAAGVGPHSRDHILEIVQRLNREQGFAILYATHEMEEAQRLCHRVAIMDRGEIVALDTPKSLIGILSIETLEPNLESVFLHLTGRPLRQ
jgi:ABC-2 type transport system ATP-binding protein